MSTILVQTTELFVEQYNAVICCTSCNINDGNDIIFKSYSVLLDHLVQHNNNDDTVSALVFAYINALKRVEGDKIRGDVEYNRRHFYDYDDNFV